MEYDVIVIGGGTAGLGAYRKAKSLGKKTLIVEGNDFVTTCASVGCMPSKLLIAASENMHEINKAIHFGINVDSVKIDHKKLLERVRSERDRFVGFVKEGADKIPTEDKIIGYATFLNESTILVNGLEYKAKSFVIATGSTPIIPEVLTHLKDEILTNESIFEIEKIPNTIAILGAGVIGLELGFAFKNLGVKVSIFDRSNKLLRLSEEVSEYLTKTIKENIDFVYEEKITKVEKVENGYHIYYGNNIKHVEKILVATGRRVNLENINIKNFTNIDVLNEYNENTTQVGNLPLFLAGDVNNRVTLLHEAAKEGVIAGENAANFPIVKSYKRNVFLAIIFSDPQVMLVGKNKDFINPIIKGSVSFENQGRSRVMLKNKGLLNLYFDKVAHKLLGAEMIGPAAEHVAHMLAWLIEKETTLEEMLELPYYHPVIEEGIRTAVREAFTKILK